MTVTPEERNQMAKILRIMEGEIPSNTAKTNDDSLGFDISGPGHVSQSDINAMHDVLKKLDNVSNQVVGEMITESEYNHDLQMDLRTVKNDHGVKVGRYQIMIKEDQKRLAGKQYYSIYNTQNKDIIADDLSLYESALGVVKLLNSGKFVNSLDVRKLFEYDEKYTSHKQDAVRYKRAMVLCERKNDFGKHAIYESRYQASIDRAMAAKKSIKYFKGF